MHERRPGIGRYAHDEREQRRIMRAVPAAAVRVGEIHDRYISGTTMRLRRVAAADEPLLDIVELAGVPLVRDVTHDGRFSGVVLANARAGAVAALLAEAARG